jgi:uncharacterized protein
MVDGTFYRNTIRRTEVDMPEAPISGVGAESIQPCAIFVDEEGDWYHEGNRIIRENILEDLFEGLRLGPDGNYLIEWNRAVCALDVADAVFVVGRVDRTESEGTNRERIWLTFRHISQGEPLDPATLMVGKDNVLYCQVRAGRFPARFSRPAYYQLAEWIQEDADSGRFYVELDGQRYAITAGVRS